MKNFIICRNSFLDIAILRRSFSITNSIHCGLNHFLFRFQIAIIICRTFLGVQMLWAVFLFALVGFLCFLLCQICLSSALLADETWLFCKVLLALVNLNAIFSIIRLYWIVWNILWAANILLIGIFLPLGRLLMRAHLLFLILFENRTRRILSRNRIISLNFCRSDLIGQKLLLIEFQDRIPLGCLLLNSRRWRLITFLNLLLTASTANVTIVVGCLFFLQYCFLRLLFAWLLLLLLTLLISYWLLLYLGLFICIINFLRPLWWDNSWFRIDVDRNNIAFVCCIFDTDGRLLFFFDADDLLGLIKGTDCDMGYFDLGFFGWWLGWIGGLFHLNIIIIYRLFHGSYIVDRYWVIDVLFELLGLFVNLFMIHLILLRNCLIRAKILFKNPIYFLIIILIIGQLMSTRIRYILTQLHSRLLLFLVNILVWRADGSAFILNAQIDISTLINWLFGNLHFVWIFVHWNLSILLCHYFWVHA